MKSPFSGMDPYIEMTQGMWEDFHHLLITEIARAIAPELPPGLFVSVATRSYVVMLEEAGKEETLAKPDVAVTEAKATKRPRKKNGGAAVAEPEESDDSVPMQAFRAEHVEEKYLEIFTEDEERILVTCIEVLSPSNKRAGSEGWDAYLRKRTAMLLGHANFVEIDLLRRGTKMPMLDPYPDSPYTLLVSRRSRAPRCRCWKGSFRTPLPTIPVPLLYGEPELSLDLQPMIDGIYSLYRYADQINYGGKLTPRLLPEDAAWIEQQLKAQPTARPKRKR